MCGCGGIDMNLARWMPPGEGKRRGGEDLNDFEGEEGDGSTRVCMWVLDTVVYV